MNKNEILEKSKKENQKADPYEMEVTRKGHEYSILAGYTICTILFIIHCCQGQGFDYELYVIMTSMSAVSNIYNAIKLKEKKYVFIAASSIVAIFAFIFLMILEMVL